MDIQKGKEISLKLIVLFKAHCLPRMCKQVLRCGNLTEDAVSLSLCRRSGLYETDVAVYTNVYGMI